MLHGDALLDVHGGLQEANIRKKCTLALSITSIVSKFQLDFSILSIVYSINKILERLGKKSVNNATRPYMLHFLFVCVKNLMVLSTFNDSSYICRCDGNAVKLKHRGPCHKDVCLVECSEIENPVCGTDR